LQLFIGHFGVGFGAKAVARKASLGTLFLAAQFLDLLWLTLLLLGFERVEIQPGITRSTPRLTFGGSSTRTCISRHRGVFEDR